MTPYHKTRLEHLKQNNTNIAEGFASRFNPKNETIIMLPGGMGSQLNRSSNRFKADGKFKFKYKEVVWVDLGLFLKKDAKKLVIKKNLNDENNHIIIPKGELDFFVKTPYDEASKFFKEQGYNYLPYGFDWRRHITESADLFHDFLVKFRSEVISKWGQNRDPLPNTTILCHSMGGLVAKLFLNKILSKNSKIADVNKWMKKLITVATPFQGTSNHIFRYFQGVDFLNTFYGKQKVCKMAATMYGSYILMFNDKESHKHNKEVLSSTPNEYPGDFPSRDHKTGEHIDPYDPSSINRYPKWVNANYLEECRLIRKQIISVLSTPVYDHIFHIRAYKKQTPTELLWKKFNRNNYNPKDHKLSDLFEKKFTFDDGKGDGTVPRWSARLAEVPNSQIYQCEIAILHGSLMEHIEPLKAAKFIIEKNKIPNLKQLRIKKGEIKSPSLATKKAVNEYLNGIKSNQFGLDDEISIDPKLWNKIMREINMC